MRWDFPKKIIKDRREILLENTFICLTGQDYEMFPIKITWDFSPTFLYSKYISEFTLIVMYLIGCASVYWPNYKGSAYTLVGWEELGFMNLFSLLYCLNSFGLVLIPSSCL